ncbi:MULTISPECIES: flagellin [unclassified Enterobacter]|uniref:flagellin N-terminal helical domain-containing protein n=1 Tax=unclassified Enterobacter TaxID=2608935 RepID=UPI00296F4359|nr:MULTISPECIES: flagellin [unclassified Enterobacter]WJD48308.1 flagellin [Enterobacter sp. PGRG2]
MQAINHNAIAGLNLVARQSTTSLLSQTIARLSSGLRINSAMDDAAGLAITNRMRSNINADTVISRGLDDATSLAQTADGSLGSVANLLIRAKSLAIQSVNDTLSESDRSSIQNEYESILAGINDLSEQTEIFGKYPLATANPELPPALIGDVAPISSKFPVAGSNYTFSSGVVPLAYLPAGSTNINLTIDSLGLDDDIQLFTRDGKHLAGTPFTGPDPDYTWVSRGITDAAKADSKLLTAANGFQSGATYDDSQLIEGGAAWNLNGSATLNYNGMTITYSGDGDRYEDRGIGAYNDGSNGTNRLERLTIDNVSEDLIVVIVGSGSFTSNLTWGNLPAPTITPATPPKKSGPMEVITSANFGDDIQAMTMTATPADTKTLGIRDTSLSSAQSASSAMGALDNALAKVSGYRAQYGAWMNRFDSAKSVLSQQTLSTQTAQSRIMDADYALETSKQIKAQILQESQNAVLKIANQLPENLLTLLRT